MVEDSDHEIPYRNPEAIVRAIQTVWTEARNDTRAPAEANGGASK